MNPARADEADPGLSATGKAAFVIELLIPDFRIERSFTDDTTRYTLAIPFAVHAGSLGSSKIVSFNHVAEVQYVLRDNVWRGSLGERIVVGSAEERHVMPLAELVGVFGADGYGGGLGAGLAIGQPENGSNIALVVRTILTNQELRADVALDFQIPLNAF